MKILKFAFIVLVIASCTERNFKPVPVVDLQKPDKARIIHLSELMNDIRIVRLETNDSILLGPDAIYLLGDKFIVSIDQSKILQFSISGAFIRTLARAGNGPGEFLRPEAFALDDRNDKLYFNHRGDSRNILTYSLKDGRLISRIPTGTDNLVSHLLIARDSVLTIVPRLNRTYNFYYLSTSGNILGGVAPPEARNIGLQTSIEIADNQLVYMPKEYDTLYYVNNLTTVPCCFFSVEDRFSYTNNETGNFVYLSSIAPGFIIANKAHARIDLNPDGETFSMNGDKQTRYLISKKDFSACEIIDFNNDFLGFREYTDQWENYLHISNNTGYICYSAFELKQKLEVVLKTDKPDDQKWVIKSELNRTLRENDNPVLIIGDLK